MKINNTYKQESNFGVTLKLKKKYIKQMCLWNTNAPGSNKVQIS